MQLCRFKNSIYKVPARAYLNLLSFLFSKMHPPDHENVFIIIYHNLNAYLTNLYFKYEISFGICKRL